MFIELAIYIKKISMGGGGRREEGEGGRGGRREERREERGEMRGEGRERKGEGWIVRGRSVPRSR